MINLEIFGGHLAKVFCEVNLEIFVSQDLIFIIRFRKSQDFLSLKITRFSLFSYLGSARVSYIISLKLEEARAEYLVGKLAQLEPPLLLL